MTAIAVLGVVVFGLLGRWQWHRASEKRLQLAAFATAGSMPVQPLGARTPAALPRFAAVAVSGQYDGDHQFLLDNISRGSRAGFEVLTPMWLADGRTVLINRGWLPLRDGSRAQLPDVSLPGAAPTTTLLVRVDELPVAGIASGKAPPPASGPWPKLTSFPGTAELANALGRAIEPRQLLLAAGQPDGFRRDWQPPNAGFSPERHMSYAIQWWSLALLAAVLYCVVNRRRS